MTSGARAAAQCLTHRVAVGLSEGEKSGSADTQSAGSSPLRRRCRSFACERPAAISCQHRKRSRSRQHAPGRDAPRGSVQTSRSTPPLCAPHARQPLRSGGPPARSQHRMAWAFSTRRARSPAQPSAAHRARALTSSGTTNDCSGSNPYLRFTSATSALPSGAPCTSAVPALLDPMPMVVLPAACASARASSLCPTHPTHRILMMLGRDVSDFAASTAAAMAPKSSSPAQQPALSAFAPHRTMPASTPLHTISNLLHMPAVGSIACQHILGEGKVGVAWQPTGCTSKA